MMLSIGNCIANSVWEADTKGRQKPTSVSCRCVPITGLHFELCDTLCKSLPDVVGLLEW